VIMSLCNPALARNRRRINRERRSLKMSRRGKLGNAAMARNRMADIDREWAIVRVGTWLNPATGDASRWIIRADGERHVALEVNGKHVCAGSERTIRTALARCIYRAGA
jgi:hypothetical protein